MPDSSAWDKAANPDELEAVLAEVLLDFDTPVVHEGEVRIALADPEAPHNMDRVPDPQSWYVEGDTPVLLQINLNVSDVSADSLEECKAGIASRLQDFVVDETGAPWPEVLVDGVSRVLDVTLDGNGNAVWVTAGKVVSRVGQLAQHRA